MSCTKSKLTDLTGTANPNNEPFIYSKIERNIVQPAPMELGTSSAVIRTGDTVTFFLPYTSRNEEFVESTVVLSDDATGLAINQYDLLPYSDPSAAQLNLPENLTGQPEFFFVTFVADESFVGKTVSITTRLEGQITISTDVLNAAFSVIP
jgi:hypothetical protein